MPWILAAASGLLYGLAFPPFAWSALSWLALAPLFLALRGARPARAAACGAVFGVVATGLVLAWLPPTLAGHFGRPWAFGLAFWAAICLVSAAPWIALVLAGWAHAARGRTPVTRAVLFAAAFVASEWLRAHAGLRSSWAFLGSAQAGAPALRQIADLTGVYGVSFLLALGAAALTELGVGLHAWRGAGLRPTAGLSAAALAGALVAGAWAYGMGGATRGAPEGRLEVAVVQANEQAELRWQRSTASRLERRYVALTREALAASPPPEIVIWPENAIQSGLGDVRVALALRQLAREAGALLFGAPRHDAADGVPRVYNSAFLLQSDGSEHYTDKRRLVPFSESQPLGAVGALGSAGDLDPGGFSAGEGSGILTTARGRIGVLLCMEALYPELAREAAAGGAMLLVNLSHDGWMHGDGAARQHFDQIVFRAIETRLPLVRSTTTGLTAVVGPDGSVIAQLPTRRPGILRASVPLRRSASFYARHGDVFALGCMGLVLLGAARPLRDGWRARAASRLPATPRPAAAGHAATSSDVPCPRPLAAPPAGRDVQR